MNSISFFLVFSLFFAAASADVLPRPKSHLATSGKVRLSTEIQADLAFSDQAEALGMALERLTGERRSITALKKEWGVEHSSIRLVMNDKLPSHAYSLSASKSIVLTASTHTGMAHAAASLLQLAVNSKHGWSVPGCLIRDEADFGYRSFMVDMGRNPHHPELLRAVVDLMWLCKANYLHLHLTDDQLISFPSKAFPKLQSKQAGWTLRDFRDLEAYSQARGVTIIPELDVPGHSALLRKIYPEVFGKSSTDLATLDSAFQGVCTVLEEMMDVFQASPYIHIGGDEAWDVDETTQRDFLNRVHRFVKGKGRKTLVWEGPKLGTGENKIDEDVIHINWRTINFKAQEMLDAGYSIVNAAWDPMYIVDHYPRTMFTAVDVEKCYTWNPLKFQHINCDIETFAKPHMVESVENVLGFCMPWWEGRQENLLPLCAMRLVAVSARAWNGRGETDYKGFVSRYKVMDRLWQLVAEIPDHEPTGGKADRIGEVTVGNLAHGKKVSVSSGAAQPHFGPQRLTNGVTDRFDHFLGFPTKPEPLEITIDLGEVRAVSKVLVFEAAVNGSWEQYEILVSEDGVDFQSVGVTTKASRGETNSVTTCFTSRLVRYVKVKTDGCKDLTFPGFSRLCEVMVFE